MRKPGTKKDETKPKRRKNVILEGQNQGIQNFFHKTETPNGDRLTPEAAILDDTENLAIQDPLRAIEQPKSKTAVRKPRKQTLKVVDPPEFHPVRATTTDVDFLDGLKIREFVLKCTTLKEQLTQQSKRYSLENSVSQQNISPSSPIHAIHLYP
jgi:hypothetical protein